MFNEGGYFERARTGKLDVQMTEDSHPAPAKSGHPKCTRSQMFEYFDWDTGDRLVQLHQYRLPNGTLGGSGQPDPKAMFVEGALYYLDKV